MQPGIESCEIFTAVRSYRPALFASFLSYSWRKCTEGNNSTEKESRGKVLGKDRACDILGALGSDHERRHFNPWGLLLFGLVSIYCSGNLREVFCPE